MNETITAEVLQLSVPERIYSSSALRIARHFWSVRAETRVLDLADALQQKPEVPVVAVTDADGIIIGIIRREKLFATLGKPFGREVLMRSNITEIVEEAEIYDANADIFAVAETALHNQDDNEIDYFPLRDESGRFRGILSSKDLASYLSKMTQDDIGLAGLLQQRLLSGNDLNASEHHRVEAWSRAAKGIGGDFYFSRVLENGRYFYCLCDVSGKGVAASIIVSMVWGMLRMYDFKRGMADLLKHLNASVVATFHMEKYLTGFFAIYEPAERKLISADMGHSHVLLIRGDKAHSVRGARMNLPIGVEPTIDPAIQSYRLREKDTLLVFSDGITEQENPEGIEFGESRLVRTVLSAFRTGRPLTEAVPEAVDAYRGTTPQGDDMSLMLLSALD